MYAELLHVAVSTEPNYTLLGGDNAQSTSDADTVIGDIIEEKLGLYGIRKYTELPQSGSIAYDK